MKAFAGLSCALLLVIRSLAAFADGGINHQNAAGLAEQNAAHSPRSQEQKAFVESRLFSVAGHTFEVPAYFLLNDISDKGVVPGITLDVGYPGGAAVGESQLHLRNGEGIRLVVSDKGVSPKQAMDNVLKYRKTIEVLPQCHQLKPPMPQKASSPGFGLTAAIDFHCTPSVCLVGQRC